jgi:hypothetical protein
MSRRDGAIVAWHEVPGKAPPQKNRPVGHGVIRADLRTDSMTGLTKFRTFQEEYLAFLKNHVAHFAAKVPRGLAAPDHNVTYGTVLSRYAVPGTSCQATIGVVPPGQLKPVAKCPGGTVRSQPGTYIAANISLTLASQTPARTSFT